MTPAAGDERHPSARAPRAVLPVGLPDPFDYAIGAAGFLIVVSTLLPAAADEAEGVGLRELLDPTWGALVVAALFAAGIGLLALAAGDARVRRLRAALALAALTGAVIALQVNAEVAASILPGPLAPFGRIGLSLAVASGAIGAAVLVRASRQRAGHESRGIAVLSLACALLVVSPVTVILAAGARTAASAGADVYAVLGFRSGALVLAAILAGAAAIDALVSDAGAAPEDDVRRGLRAMVIDWVGSALALAAPVLALAYVAGVAIQPGRVAMDTLDPAPWMTELYGEALPELADTIALAATGDRHLPDIEAALDRASSLASPEPKLRRAVDALGETLRWGVPSPQALAHAEDRLNRAAESLGVPFFVDVQLSLTGYGPAQPGLRLRSPGLAARCACDLETTTKPNAGPRCDCGDVGRPFRERANLLAYRTVRVRTTKTGDELVRTWWLERVDHGIVVEQRLGWTRPGRAECSIILDVVRRRLADELEPDVAACEAESDRLRRGQAAPPAYARLGLAARCACDLPSTGSGDSYVDRFEALTANVEAHEIQHALDRDHLEPPRALRRAMTYHAEPAIAAATGELSAFLAEVGRGGSPKSALTDMTAFAARFPDSAEGHAAELALEALTQEGETTAHLFALDPDTLAARAREAYQRFFARPLPVPELVRDQRLTSD